MAPLNKLLEKNKPFIWMEECTKAYQELKDVLLKEPVVAYSDFSVPFRLYTDASNIGLGAILAQKQEGWERIICCASRTLNKSEQNYIATKKEYLALVWRIKNFWNYLIANHFKVYTDHYSLQWLRAMKNVSALLEDYDFEIFHQPGKNQGIVDALSRLPIDKVNFLGKERTVLQTAKILLRYQNKFIKTDIWGLRKSSNFSAKDLRECGKKLSVRPLSRLARVTNSGQTINPRHIAPGED